ncbi:MAG: M15 family metallopeptidase [Ilumatobacteraceae bacterium]
MRRPVTALVALLAASLATVATAAVGDLGRIDGAAEVDAVTSRIDRPVGDLAVAFDVGPVDRAVVEALDAASRAAGGSSSTRRGGSVGLRRIVRGTSVVHAPPSGHLIPMVFTAAPRSAHRGVYGFEIASVLGAGKAVVNELMAETTGARVGDLLQLRTAGGGTLSVRIGSVAADADVGGSEIVIDTSIADLLGFVDDTSAVAWGFTRDRFDREVRRVGLDTRANTRVARSWDRFDPDWTLSTVRAKALLGEPWYRIEVDGSIVMHPTWIETYLTDGRVLLDPVIQVRAQCHREVVGDLSAALADVAAAGLAAEIDVVNTNTFGGCFVPRYSRDSGYLSRHTYGMAFDTNTVSNCLGCRPVMNCRIVRIFREHGFAWGGNFRRPDGMHFEWVGEPRHLVDFPSEYCPNEVDAAAAVPSTLGRTVLAIGADPGAVSSGP